MKLLLGTLILTSTAAVFGQDVPAVPAAPAAPAAPARLAIMPANGADVIVAGVTKNMPFTADESGESVRILPDGNRITETWSGKIARNGLGNVRREVTSGKAGVGIGRPVMFDGGASGHTVVAVGSTGELRHKIEGEIATTSRVHVVAAPAEHGSVNVITRTGHTDEAKAAVEGRAIAVAGARTPEHSRAQTRKEDLGSRDFGGVQADGTRVITTYAAGTVGNDRDIEVTSEIWFSKELGVIVHSKRSDPRTGETTYQMTNIVRAEPDPSLFTRK